ncbi:MAG: DNA polymerase III subunit delta' [Lachnospiraceae bacterium]|nr:DNA polymerase III subunit delta' [Lachnospiraceae bacterium]
MMGFRDIIGQERIIAGLKGAVKSGHAAHAYIFDGEKGMGKKTLAYAFARALLCEEPLENREDAEACGHCHSCIMAESGSHPDLITLVPEKETSIGVDDIRKQVVNDVPIKPYCSAKKIYIIPDANLMTEAAENALLKTLEEPPSYAVIILLSENKDRLLPTIVSRAVCFPMRAVGNEEISRYLENKGLGAGETSAAISFARGNLGRAVLLSESEEFKELSVRIRRTLTGVRDMTDTEISAAASEAAEKKEERDDILSFLLLWFRDVLYLKAGGSEDRLIFANEIREIDRAAAAYSFEKINRIIEEIKTARSRLKSNVNPENTFELLYMTMR